MSASVYKIYQPSALDEQYMAIARAYRLRMKPPEQSFFRVVAILTFRVFDQNTNQMIDKLEHVIGCNVETPSIRASICGERCALFNLVARYPAQNFLIDKVYILTDSEQPCCAGLLCLEFLSTFGFKSPAGIQFVLFTPTGNVKVLTGNICTAYPFPSIYKYLGDEKPSDSLYKKVSKSILKASNHAYIVNNEWPRLWRDLYKKCIQMSKYDDKQWHPLSFGGGVLFEDNEMECCWMSKALEYGASIECVTKLMHKMQIEKMKGNKALMLMIVDDYGVLHAPNGMERTALNEQGFGDLKVAIHYHTEKNPKFFYQTSESFNQLPTHFEIFIKKIEEIVPAPPNTNMLNSKSKL